MIDNYGILAMPNRVKRPVVIKKVVEQFLETLFLQFS